MKARPDGWQDLTTLLQFMGGSPHELAPFDLDGLSQVLAKKYEAVLPALRKTCIRRCCATAS
ncbi:MAG: hypothetical protein L0Z53_07915, partial [Acidobacteriales bacterium]|nr:hypothetical protein [Terriglobales bacterium]